MALNALHAPFTPSYTAFCALFFRFLYVTSTFVLTHNMYFIINLISRGSEEFYINNIILTAVLLRTKKNIDIKLILNSNSALPRLAHCHT